LYDPSEDDPVLRELYFSDFIKPDYGYYEYGDGQWDVREARLDKGVKYLKLAWRSINGPLEWVDQELDPERYRYGCKYDINVFDDVSIEIGLLHNCLSGERRLVLSVTQGRRDPWTHGTDRVFILSALNEWALRSHRPNDYLALVEIVFYTYFYNTDRGFKFFVPSVWLEQLRSGDTESSLFSEFFPGETLSEDMFVTADKDGHTSWILPYDRSEIIYYDDRFEEYSEYDEYKKSYIYYDSDKYYDEYKYYKYFKPKNRQVKRKEW
jgi:hypothetical protein